MLSALSSTSSTDAAAASGGTGAAARDDFYALLRDNWFVLVALAAVIVPTLVNLSRESWSTEAGSHGPIVLATGLWLLHHSMPEIFWAARLTCCCWRRRARWRWDIC
jgi:hypothetical protein